MDVGVGGFVFSQGLVYAGSRAAQPNLIFLDQLRRACLSSLPLFALGLGRLMLVKASDYQEHTSEYGVHWNFFFTLAFLPPFVTLVRFLFRRLNEGWLAIVVACTYQFVLSDFELEYWILNAERKDLLSANKEGLCSLFGLSRLNELFY